MKGVQLQMPFLGIGAGICVFLAAGLEIFGFPWWLSYSISLPLTLFISLLVWSQLGKLLNQLEQGGSKALDLDSIT
jgi:membrane protein implicated in regulation of membrane protease activity